MSSGAAVLAAEPDRAPQARTVPGTGRPDPSSVAAALLGAASLATGWAVLGLLVALWLTSRHMPARSPVRRAALAVLVLMSLNAIALTCLAVLGVRSEPRWLVAGVLLVGALASARPGPGPRDARSAGSDLWGLGASAVVLAVLARPLLGAPVERLAASLARGTDGGTHLMLVRAVMREGGYIGLLPSVPGVLPGLEDYPSAWAAGTALVLELLLGPAPDPAPFLRAVSLLVVAGYALLAFFATVLALDVARAAAGQLGPRAQCAGTTCLLIPTLLGSTALLQVSQSFAQIAATTVLLAAVSVVAGQRSSSYAGTAVLALLGIGLFHTWYLLAPVLAVVVLAHVLLDAPRAGRLVLTALVAAPLALYPVLTGPAPGTQVAVPGTAPMTPLAAAVLLLLALVALLGLLVGATGGRRERLVVAATLVSCLVSMCTVLALQESGAGGNYYATKLLYTQSVLAVVAAAAVVAAGAARPGLTRGRPGTVVLVLAVVGCLAVSSSELRRWSVPLVTGGPRPAVGEPALAQALGGRRSWVPDGTDVWVLTGCTRAQDRQTNQFLTSLSLGWDPQRLVVFEDFIDGADDDIGMLLLRADDPRVRRMEVYVSRECLPDDLAALERRPKVALIHV